MYCYFNSTSPNKPSIIFLCAKQINFNLYYITHYTADECSIISTEITQQSSVSYSVR